jgi:protein SCO1/2
VTGSAPSSALRCASRKGGRKVAWVEARRDVTREIESMGYATLNPSCGSDQTPCSLVAKGEDGGWIGSVVMFLLLAMCALSAWGHEAKAAGRLPTVGPAPAFALTNQSGARVSLADHQGKVLAVTFIYATCKDTCPILTAKMATIQRKLGADFGPKVRFASITVEPEIDTPAVLKAYAEKYSADLAGWSFLTGASKEIQDVVRRYGAFAKRLKAGDVDHLFLTSLIDRKGMLRVQYLGYRFDPDEMERDLRALLAE